MRMEAFKVNYFVVTDRRGSVVWRGMAENEAAALDAAARSCQLGSYRYAVAIKLLAPDEWKATAKPLRMCHIFGRVNGRVTELIAAPIATLGDVDRLQNEIPDSLYDAVERNTIDCRLIG